MNRLGAETSPYLRQHADNPVEWYPWGDIAFDEAKRLDRPVFVSIGYSACHWCHVMAHESFEDPETARYLNEHFVSIKVDREEHPDVDAIYMEAVQAMTGGGGWPLSAFTGADRRPFFGGTYFPRVGRQQIPSFRSVLEAIIEAWGERRDELARQADALIEAIGDRLAPPPGGATPTATAALKGGVERFAAIFDPEWGGVGRAPKFPQAPMLELLLRSGFDGNKEALDMAETTLVAMAAGGLYDQLGGGFARYSTDRTWTVPHFEKMLYDQAALARLYLHAHLLTGDSRWREICLETLDYVRRDLALETGGLASAEDADSEGEEGRFYVWTPDEVREVLERAGLGDTVEETFSWYGLDRPANFEGHHWVLERPEREVLHRPASIEAARVALFKAREGRVRPGLDEKVLTEWNAMAAGVMAEASLALGEDDLLKDALSIGRFLLASLRRSDGRWLRAYHGGTAAHLAVATDYAWLLDCFTRLGEASGAASWIEEASRVATDFDALFSAPDGGFFLSGSDVSGLPVRPRDSFDGVLPAAASIGASALARLGALLGDERLNARASAAVASSGEALSSSPLAFAHLVGAGLLLEKGAIELVIVGERPELVRTCATRYLPDAVLSHSDALDSPLWQGKTHSAAYVCRNGACLAPSEDPESLNAAIDLALAARR